MLVVSVMCGLQVVKCREEKKGMELVFCAWFWFSKVQAVLVKCCEGSFILDQCSCRDIVCVFIWSCFIDLLGYTLLSLMYMTHFQPCIENITRPCSICIYKHVVLYY